MYPPFPEGPGHGFALARPWECVSTSQVDSNSSLETSRYYNTLSVGILPPPFPILVNPLIDTLALSYHETTQFWAPSDLRAVIVQGGIFDFEEKHAKISLRKSLACLRDLLHRDRANLELTQAIAVGNVRWPSSGGTPGNWDKPFLTAVEDNLQDSFRNLNRITLVKALPGEGLLDFGSVDGLKTPEGRELCIQQIRQMFEARGAGVKVPEVVILDPGDPEAPHLSIYDS